MAMTVTTEKLEASKKLARDYIDQVFNQHNPAKAADFVTGDVVWHGGALGDITGAENLAGLLGSFIGALPDLRAAERDIIAENDLVVVRLVVTATVKGSLLGAPADGKPVHWDAVDIYRVTDRKISEEWADDDVAAIMAQIGAFSPPWAA
jgi:predicted ester cyclase